MANHFVGLLGVRSARQADSIRRVGNERLLSPYTETKDIKVGDPRSTLSFMGFYKVTEEITAAPHDPEVLLGDGKARAFRVKEDLPANPGDFSLKIINKSNEGEDHFVELPFLNFTKFFFRVDQVIMGFMDVYSHKMFALPFEDVFWGKAKVDSVTGIPCDYVTINPCEDCAGNGVDLDVARERDVILPRRQGFLHQVTQGDVISYTLAEDGTWTIVSDYSFFTDSFWGRVTSGVITFGNNCDSVEVQPAVSCGGADKIADPITVLLPHRNTYTPELPAGSYISYSLTEDLKWVIESDYTRWMTITFWGQVQGQPTIGQGPGCDKVNVFRCSDCDGTGAAGPAIEVNLPRRDGFETALSDGDVIAVIYGPNHDPLHPTNPVEEYVIHSDYSSQEPKVVTFWGRVTSQITPGGKCDLVNVQPIIACGGVDKPDAEIVVRLPKRVGYVPDLSIDDHIAYTLAQNFTWVIQSDYSKGNKGGANLSSGPAIVTVDITAREGGLGDAPGIGIADLLTLDGFSDFIVAQSGVEIFNWSQAAYKVGEWIHVDFGADNKYWIDAVDCKDEPAQQGTVQ